MMQWFCSSSFISHIRQGQMEFSTRKQAGCGWRCILCFPRELPGIVYTWQCICKAFIPNFGQNYYSLQHSCSGQKLSAYLEFGGILAHLLSCVSPLGSQLSLWVLKTGVVNLRKSTNNFIPALPEGRVGAERFPAQWCRFKRLRYTSDKQPQLGVNHNCLDLLGLMYSWKDCHLLSDEI